MSDRRGVGDTDFEVQGGDIQTRGSSACSSLNRCEPSFPNSIPASGVIKATSRGLTHVRSKTPPKDRRFCLPNGGHPPHQFNTLLRLVRSGVVPPCVSPCVVGIDEWAWRRGRRYGTMIVDLERNEIVDLLPDRDAGTLANWLKAHPAVEIIARDRAEVFADGTRAGSPNACEVVDRWHLLCNIGEAFKAAVSVHHRQIRQIADGVRTRDRQAAHQDYLASRTPTAAECQSQARHDARAQMFAELTRLIEDGTSQIAASRAIGLDRKTARRWIRRGSPPTWRKPKRSTVLDPHLEYLERRWREGCRNSAELSWELIGQGADVHPRVVREWATHRRRESADRLDTYEGHSERSWPPTSIRQTAPLLQADIGKLADNDRCFIEEIRKVIPALVVVVDLVEDLTRMLRRQCEAPNLTKWFEGAANLRRDEEAVIAAIETPWTTSPVEGQISRLKMIKRTMYGRAGFDLLRQRILAPL
ncbi:MAG: ISL3 family transposase [Fulvimarina manganoxydans]|uniref:ISL3 family transposase n=1 Tax=Fulvimarina manganoxydans TaxID=937218 RepID=UPI00235602EC|nr:ISL3 family transposase [Fulvimarina manganoxydans]MCK5933794.1 ISL3 family transposase [Fulvimarina manganoxydans]